MYKDHFEFPYKIWGGKDIYVKCYPLIDECHITFVGSGRTTIFQLHFNTTRFMIYTADLSKAIMDKYNEFEFYRELEGLIGEQYVR